MEFLRVNQPFDTALWSHAGLLGDVEFHPVAFLFSTTEGSLNPETVHGTG